MAIPGKPLYSDHDLLTLLWQDDRRGLEILFRIYYRNLHQFVFLIIKNRAVAEDIVQDVFIKIWRLRHELRNSTRFKPYLYKACRNMALNQLDYQKKHQFDSDKSHQIPAPGNRDLIETKQLSDYLIDAVENLPPRRRLIFHMSRFQDMTYQEIASYLDISVKTVENQISAALKTIRRDLGEFI